MYQHKHFAEHQAFSSVFRPRSLMACLTAAIIGMAGFSGFSAAEPVALPLKPMIGATGAAVPQTSVPLRDVMRLNPLKFKSRATQNPSLTESGLQAACSAVDPGRYAQLLRTIEEKESICASAAYSVEDQRAAGCGGADTVDQCQSKLFSYCMDRGGDRAAFKNAADQELAQMRKARDKLDAHMQYIANTRPLHSGESGANRGLPEYSIPKINMALPPH